MIYKQFLNFYDISQPTVDIKNFDIDNKVHYVYRITNIMTKKYYYGCRQCNGLPSEDIGIKYFSSSSDGDFMVDQKNNPQNYKYKIVKVFNNNGDKLIFESFLHKYFNVRENDKFYNLSNQSIKFDVRWDPNRYRIWANTKTDGGLTNAQIIGLKAAETKKIKDPGTGLSINDLNNLHQKEYWNFKIGDKTRAKLRGEENSGECHYNFKGYFLVFGNKYITSRSAINELNLNITHKTLIKWCKNSATKITKHVFCRCNFLKGLGSQNYIVGKTYRDIGFDFEIPITY